MNSTTDRLSPTPDEYAHLVSGISYYQTGSHYLYCVNPPLVKRIATYSLVTDGMRIDPLLDGQQDSRTEWLEGDRFAERYGPMAFEALVKARRSVLWFAIFGTVGVFLLTQHLIGWGCASIASTLWASSPWVLGFGMLVQTDVPAAAMGVWAIYTFTIAMRRCDLTSSLIAGLFLGFAILTKFTWVIAWPLWPFLALCPWKDSPFLHRRISIGCLACIISWFTVLAGYHFEDVGRPLGDYVFASKTLGGPGGLDAIGNCFKNTWLESIPSPFPGAMIKGLDWQLRDVQSNSENMLFGEWKDGGWWYYYLAVLAIKTRLSVLALLLLGGWIAWRDRQQALLPYTIIAIVILWLISRHVGMNSHGRYLIPVLPLLFIIASNAFRNQTGTAKKTDQRDTFPRHYVITCSCLILSLVETAVAFPYHISYSNAAFGGPHHTYKWLAGSNDGWDHGWIEVRDWLQAQESLNPDVLVLRPRWLQASPLGLQLDDLNSVTSKEMVSADDLILLHLNRSPTDLEANTVKDGAKPIRTFAHCLGLYRVSDVNLKGREDFLLRLSIAQSFNSVTPD